jgi:hypothetical protein
MPKPALMKDSIYRRKAIKWILAFARMDRGVDCHLFFTNYKNNK